MPPLKCAQGDRVGMIRRLIDLNLQALENEGFIGAILNFDADSGTYLEAAGNFADRDELAPCRPPVGDW